MYQDRNGEEREMPGEYHLSSESGDMTNFSKLRYARAESKCQCFELHCHRKARQFGLVRARTRLLGYCGICPPAMMVSKCFIIISTEKN